MDTKRVGSKILKVLYGCGIIKVATEEDEVTVLYPHQLVLEVSCIEVEEHLLVTFKFEIIGFWLDVQLGLVG
jgi:hypothetical protein